MKRSLFVGCLLLMLTAVFFWTGCEQATDEVIEGSGLPKAPDSFEVFAADGEVLLSWNIYQPNNQDIIRFEVEYGEGDTAPFPAVVPVAKEWDYLHSSILIKNLTNNTLYGFRVRAVNNKGNSPWSVVQSATPQRATVAPVTPASVSADESKMSATAEGANLFVQWNPSAGASKYEVRYSTADLDSTNTEFENTAFIFKSADGATTITEQWANIPAPKPHGNAPLALDTKYYFWVRAGNEVGWSSWAKGEATTKAFSGTTAPNIAKRINTAYRYTTTFTLK